MYRYLLSALALALAPLLAFQAQVNSGGSAPAWARAWNGFTLSEAALGEVDYREAGGQVGFRVPKKAEELARQAYSAEPLATDALFVLSIARGPHSNDLARASYQLDQRNRLLGLSLLGDAALEDDLAAMLPLVDRMARIEPTFAGELVKGLTDTLADPAAFPLLEQALNENPAWAEAFWRRVPRESAALANYLQLRSALQPAPDEQTDQALLLTLVETQRYKDAFDLYASISNQGRSGGDTEAGHYPPIDWQLVQGRDAYARRSSSGRIEIFIDRGASGDLARQLVELSPGTFRLQGNLDNLQGEAAVTATLECASDGELLSSANQLLNGTPMWTIEGASCSHGIVTLRGEAWESALPFKGSIKGLEFSRD